MGAVPARYNADEIIGFPDPDRTEINMYDQEKGDDEAQYDMKKISHL